MDERFMNSLRRDPDAGFGRDLHQKLRAQETPRVLRVVRPAPALAFGLAVAVIVALFAFPSMRVSAQQMLDLFRVRKFAAVQFDEKRLEKLHEMKGDQSLMVFDTETIVKEGPPQVVPTIEAGAALAGLDARRPTYLPNGLALDTVAVEGPGAARLTVNETKLRALLEALDLRDVAVPVGIDGKAIEVKKPAILVQQYKGGRFHAALVQAMSPEVSVPPGVDVERLGEIGLRILGLDAGEAHRVATATDWRTTLVVPVPINASTFRQVTVHGQPGLLVTTTMEAKDGRPRRDGTVALWSENDRVFGLLGNLGADDVLQMAESVR